MFSGGDRIACRVEWTALRERAGCSGRAACAGRRTGLSRRGGCQTFTFDLLPAVRLLRLGEKPAGGDEAVDRILGARSQLEKLAAGQQDSAFKTQLLNQATAYRKLAAKRAVE